MGLGAAYTRFAGPIGGARKTVYPNRDNGASRLDRPPSERSLQDPRPDRRPPSGPIPADPRQEVSLGADIRRPGTAPAPDTSAEKRRIGMVRSAEAWTRPRRPGPLTNSRSRGRHLSRRRLFVVIIDGCAIDDWAPHRQPPFRFTLHDHLSHVHDGSRSCRRDGWPRMMRLSWPPRGADRADRQCSACVAAGKEGGGSRDSVSRPATQRVYAPRGGGSPASGCRTASRLGRWHGRSHGQELWPRRTQGPRGRDEGPGAEADTEAETHGAAHDGARLHHGQRARVSRLVYYNFHYTLGKRAFKGRPGFPRK
jgi:hypothetical protein